MIFSSSLILKRGVAPFHFWFPNVIEGLNWTNRYILITWQKIAPLIILTYCLNFFFIIFAILFSAFIGSIGGLNQTSIRKLIAYSSINHLGWIISSIISNENILKIYFFFYSFISLTIIIIFKNFNIFNINQIFSLNFKIKIKKLLIFISLLSLGGLPPFLGFFPKWLIIETLIFFNFFWILLFLINFSLITIYFYIRISYSSFLINFNKINFNLVNFNKFKNKNIFIFFLLFISIFGLLFINLIYVL